MNTAFNMNISPKVICFSIALAALAACNGTNNNTPNPGTPAAKGTVTEFSGISGPVWITIGPDSSLWFTEFFNNKIGRITTLGATTEFAIPTGSAGAFGIITGADGNLWFAEQTASKIGRITPAGVVTEFATITPAAIPRGIAAGSDNALWFTEVNKDRIGRITTAGAM